MDDAIGVSQLPAASREHSPHQHDAEAVPAGSTLLKLSSYSNIPTSQKSPWLVLGCGTGQACQGAS